MEPDTLQDLALLREPARQSPVAITQTILSNFRRIGAFNLVIGFGLLVSNSIPAWLLPIIPIAALAFVAAGIAAWWRLTFRATDDELIVTRGVLSRDTLTIPLSKVQSISIEEGLIQRVFGLVSASVDTAGALEVEFSIHGIKREQAEALRRLVSQARPSPEPRPDAIEHLPPPVPGTSLDLVPPTGPARQGETGPNITDPPTILVQRTARELMLIGMLGNPLGGLAILGAFLLFADDAGQSVGIELPDVDGSTVELSPQLVATVVGAAIAVFALSWLAFGVRTMVTDWDLELASTKDGIGINAGLLKRRSQSSHINKVQSVQATHGPLLRLVGFCQLRLHTIGSGDLVLPGVTPAELDEIRDTVSLPFSADPDQRISVHFVYQRVRLVSYLAVPAGLLTAFLDLRFVAAWLILPLVAAVRAHLIQRSFRWDITGRTISRRSGNLFISETGVSMDKTQSVSISQSYYQRRRHLSSIRISNAESALSIPMLSLTESQSLRDLLLA